MRFQALQILLLGYVASTVASTKCLTSSPELYCSEDTPHSVEYCEEKLAKQRDMISCQRSKNPGFSETINIDVYIHVIANETHGHLDNQTLSRHISRINRDFTASNIAFKIKGVDKIVRSWPIGFDNTHDMIMKSGIQRKGDMSALNIFFLAHIDDPLKNHVLGWSSMPWWAMQESIRDVGSDGIFIHSETVPTSLNITAKKDESDTTTHEIGHWLGLFHPWDNTLPDCSGPGDGIDDTPAMTRNNIKGALGPDSCPDLAGMDPVDNFMVYTHNSGENKFTPQQIERMRAMWFQYRAPDNGTSSLCKTA
ncbi:hypothetical protein DCS_00779 [Drechmeria coniospora]|uniref:Peptidase M43 pregnancy-associated plasma-A domain-containing protein n=1 Tax=Drechmeria coniospora TaxID=98403 RepID=A0A151GRB9_DRECN|nr:hypothetical protein DCS_00779 [Drechmeria coniospora]KAH8836205.1 hypothetical protein RJ55_10069 [Drechmeria coniospora]KYK59646.1 hypothetical protein DCS_00779 [Drechmeria coniospora]